MSTIDFILDIVEKIGNLDMVKCIFSQFVNIARDLMKDLKKQTQKSKHELIKYSSLFNLSSCFSVLEILACRSSLIGPWVQVIYNLYIIYSVLKF